MVLVVEEEKEVHYCQGCGVLLAPYEVFACRIRGLKKPVCLGCLIEALVFMKRDLLPLLTKAVDMMIEKANETETYIYG
jgi:hypothetical protein